MDAKKSQAAFAALAQPTRLKAFRKLVAAHPKGLPAGDIAAYCKVPHNTMSTHLASLMRGGLIAVTRDGRSMNYRANLEGFRGLIDFMLRDCCGGRPEICAPVVQEFNATCCTPARKAASFSAGVQGAVSSFMRRDKTQPAGGSAASGSTSGGQTAPAASAAESFSDAAAAAAAATSEGASAAASSAADVVIDDAAAPAAEPDTKV